MRRTTGAVFLFGKGSQVRKRHGEAVARAGGRYLAAPMDMQAAAAKLPVMADQPIVVFEPRTEAG